MIYCTYMRKYYNSNVLIDKMVCRYDFEYIYCYCCLKTLKGVNADSLIYRVLSSEIQVNLFFEQVNPIQKGTNLNS
jgi:hypothetical protein